DARTARFASLLRLLTALVEMRRRIPVLEARLGTAVARAAELTLTSSVSSSAAELDVLRAELDQLVDELGALQSAVAAAG
ncbi:MAG: hypothetical protein Q8K58_06925, partial [Acidimicrobiales bacterium]|nr:hypothetical protein [Acidimicrobiales bacterium]